MSNPVTIPVRNAAQPPSLIQALQTDPRCYDHPVDHVQMIETHISWVLLTGEVAYKIKKPVNLCFLDFSSLEKRKQACADEVRLNRRLAPDIYLGVVTITGNAGEPRINGTSEIFEYAVKMRQFSPEATFDCLSERGELGFVQIDALATRLAQFHSNECATATAESLYGEPNEILNPVRDNFRILAEQLKEPELLRKLSSLQSWSVTEHERLVPLMRQRKQQGKIRECHGDLHLGNLAWVNAHLIIFDCIEFSAALRWIDVISEVAFCFMDLLHRNHFDLAFRFLNAWLEASGDYESLPLLRYYAVYRAVVRAKVAALSVNQLKNESAEIEECLKLAEHLTRVASPQLWITHGFSGCGKTTLSQKMLQERGMVRMRSDVERKRLAGISTLSSSNSRLAEGIYTPEFSRRTYSYLKKMAAYLLNAGWQVIIDAAFLERWQRDLFRELAQQQAMPFHILDIRSDQATLEKRVAHRVAQGQNASEADLHVLRHQIETAQPLSPDEMHDLSEVDGNTE